MKKTIAAAVAAAILGFVFLFAQGPVTKVRLWDTNLSHSLLLQWNENDVTGRTLNLLVAGATRSLTISGDSYIDQDVRIAATPTHAGLYLSSSTAAPFLKMTNESNTARDPIQQMAVGATPVVKWTWGLDDSEDDNWKLANATSLGAAKVGSFEFGEVLYYTHSINDIHGVQLSDFSTDAVYIVGGTGSGDGEFDHPRQIAYNGTYIYVADDGNDRVQKFVASTGAFVSKTTSNITRPWGCVYWNGFIYVASSSGTYQGTIRKFDAETMVFQSTFGSFGAGNDQFNGLRSMTTDGTYLYICDSGNHRVKKHALSGTYSAQVGSLGTGDGQFGTSSPIGIATDGTYIYVSDYGNERVQIFLCSTLAYVAQVAMQDRGAGPGSCTSISLNGTYFYVTCLNDLPYLGYVEKYDIATRTFQAFFDPAGTADDSWGCIILKDRVFQGDQIVVHEDGQWVDIYPKTRFFDYVRIYEGAVETGEYVGLRVPADVTASHHLTLPGATNAAKSQVYATTGGILGWGQNVDTDGSPSLVRLTITQATGTSPLAITSTTVNTNLNSDLWEGLHLPALDNGKFLTNNGATLSWAAGAGAPTDAKYIVQEANGGLSAEQSLGALATGILKNTAAAGVGVLSIAVGADLPAHDHTFVSLTDTPAAYAGSGGYVVKVKGDASGLEFVAGGAGVASFNDLDDVPASYVGQAGFFAKVKATEDGLEYAAGGGAPANAQYLTIASDGTLTDERIISPQGTIKGLDGGAGSGYYLTHGLKYKTAVDAPDDDFTADVLDGKWTVVDGASGTVALLGTAGNIYDLTTRDSYLLVQAINGDEFQIRQDYTLPDHSSIILCVSGSVSFDGAPAITNNELWAGIAINDNDGGFNSGTYQLLFFDTDTNNVRGHHYNGSTQGALPAGTFPIGQKVYCRFARENLTYYAFMSVDGENWLPMGSVTVAGAYNNVWIFVDSQATVSTPTPIQAFDWIRLGTNAVDPW